MLEIKVVGLLKKMSKSETRKAAITRFKPVKYRDVLECALFLFITVHQTHPNKVNVGDKS